METAAVQRRTLVLLFVTQIISGIGVAIGASVGATGGIASGHEPALSEANGCLAMTACCRYRLTALPP